VLAFAIFAVALRVRELVFFNGLIGAAELMLAMLGLLSKLRRGGGESMPDRQRHPSRRRGRIPFNDANAF
jgi:hypothetical protein